MSQAAATLTEIDRYLDEIYTWVLKSRGGLTREDAKKIFHRYRSRPAKSSEPDPSSQEPRQPVSEFERQSRKIDQIIGYMEETTQRLDHIENDINYLKEKIDQVLEKL